MGIYFGSTFGYMRLDSWVMSKIIQLATMSFCRRFLDYTNDPKGRQFDQTTLAARSVPANIAEGSSRHDTSKETELRLLDVSRASISEVLDDFMFFVMDKGERVWDEHYPMAQEIRNLRLDTPTYTINLLHEASDHVLKQKAKFDVWLESKDMLVVANTIIILCERVTKMLHRQMDRRLEEFKEEGGFTENMTQTRLEAKREQNAAQGAPRCPICGEVMVVRTIRKGEHQGSQFWGCSNFPKTGCQGKLPYNKE